MPSGRDHPPTTTHRHTRTGLTAAAVLVVGFALSGCTATRGTEAEAEAPVDATIAVAPGDTVQTTTSQVATTTPQPGDAPSTTQPRRAANLPRTVRPVDPMKTPLPELGQSSGPETVRLQKRMLQLGYWLSGVDGTYGITTTQAVMAFQKYNGLDASGAVDEATAEAISNADVKPYGRSDTGDLIEVDKERQLLFVIRDGLTEWVFNTSTGSGEEYVEEDKNSPGVTIVGLSDTPNGLFRVDRERPEGWWEGDLGEIYRPKYFKGGIAVHGSNSIPNYPASHGCVRLSVPAMDFVWDADLMPMWSTVWVHEGV